MSRRLLAAATTLAVAFVLLGGPAGQAARADQEDPRLDGLFERLQTTGDRGDARALEQQIWQIWVASEDPSVNRLMRSGLAAMRARRYQTALATFTRLVEAAPEFAEGWNKRATVHYLMGNLRASVLDIQKTLALEPRHFGALFGLGLIYDALDQPAAALRSYEATLEINPHSSSTRRRIEELRRELQGRRT